jgi:hypothetical protein
MQPQNVAVIWQGNRRREGTIISAINWGSGITPNWYIEMRCYLDSYQFTESKPYYVYWKQAEDGGVVVFHHATQEPAE